MKPRQIKFYCIWFFGYVFILPLLIEQKLQNMEATTSRASLKIKFLKSMQNPWKVPGKEDLYLAQLNMYFGQIRLSDNIFLNFRNFRKECC